MTPECSFARGLVQLRLGCNHMRWTLPAQTHAARVRSAIRALALLSAFGRACIYPGRLHVAMPKRVSRLLGNVDLVRRQLQTAVLYPRAQRQVQPLSRALI